MTNLEMIEKLSQKAGISKEQAEDALVKSNWDILDAMLYIERQNTANPVTCSSGYSTYENRADNIGSERNTTAAEDMTFGWYMNKASSFIKTLFKKSISNSFVITKNDREIISFPVLILVLLILISVSGFLILLIVGMFFDFRYSFLGADLGKPEINSVMDKLFELVRKIKLHFKQ